MARDVNSKRQNERLQAIQRQYDQEDDEALRALLGTPDGRQVLMRLARNCRWMGDPWDATSVRLTDYESGRRAAGLDLMGWVERVSGDHFLLMQQEAQARDVMAGKLKSAAVTESKDGNQEQDDG